MLMFAYRATGLALQALAIVWRTHSRIVVGVVVIVIAYGVLFGLGKHRGVLQGPPPIEAPANVQPASYRCYGPMPDGSNPEYPRGPITIYPSFSGSCGADAVRLDP
jgi:hypothetical protein